MTTVHAYTNTQLLLDVEHKDLRRARAAAMNIIPTTTGAALAIAKIFPDLEGKVPCTAIRVPVAKVSLVDVSFATDKPMTVKTINQAFQQAAQKGSLLGIVAVSHEPLVSSNYNANSYSVTLDALLTQAVGSTGRVFGWYDNEWGYSERLKDFLLKVS